jgi:predicted alpha/beta-fold hydrolase
LHAQGFNKIYNWNLASSLKRIFLKHQPLWRTYQGPGQPERVPEVNTIREFDEAITVHSFGECYCCCCCCIRVAAAAIKQLA